MTSMSRRHWRLHEMWYVFINLAHGRSPFHGRKVLSEKTISDVRIPSGYRNREPLDLSPLALW